MTSKIEADTMLYYNTFSSPSRKVLMALYEKGVEFTPKNIDLLNNEQLERWYLEINPRGEVPVLKHGEKVVVDSTEILCYVDQHFGKQHQLFPEATKEKVDHFIKQLDSIPTFLVTYGAVLYHAENVTKTLRYPYCREDVRCGFRKLFNEREMTLKKRSQEVSEMEASKILADKSAFLRVLPVFHDVDKYRGILSQVEALLDEVEKELGSDSHLGAWLCGPTFTAADVSLTALLLRLHQIGLDDVYWKDGVRPQISVYAETAFKRPAFERATGWSRHSHESMRVVRLDQDQTALNSAYVGLGAAIALGAVYAYKKLKK